MSAKDWGYIKTRGNEIIIDSYRGNDTVVIVPEKIGERKVVGILSFAFSPMAKRIVKERQLFRAKIEEVVIPEGVKKLGRCVFSGCKALRKITLPNSLNIIGDFCFLNCENLEEIATDNFEIGIGYHTFEGCNKLNKNELSFSPFVIENGILKSYADYKKEYEIVIPNGVTEIGNYAFKDCYYIRNVIIPDGVKRIGDYAFDGCCDLENIEIPDSVVEIGEDAFENCPLLKINYPKKIRNENRQKFYAELQRIHETYCPELRFGQMILNFMGSKSPFCLEDGKFIAELQSWAEEIPGTSEAVSNICVEPKQNKSEIAEKLCEKIVDKIYLIAEDEKAYPVIKRIKKWKYSTGECSNINYTVLKGLSEDEVLSVIERAKKRKLILIYGDNCEDIKKRITDYDGVIITSSQLPDMDKFIAFAETLSFAFENNELSTFGAATVKEFFHNVETIDLELMTLGDKSYHLEPLSTEKDRVLFSMSYPSCYADDIESQFYDKYFKRYDYNMMHRRNGMTRVEARIIIVREKRE